MSKMSNEAIQAQMDSLKARGLMHGNIVKDSTDTTVATSQLLYVDSDGTLQSGSIPFEFTMTGTRSTASACLDLQGVSTGSANLLLQGTLVDGSNVTTFTNTGYIQVKITDDGGNITNGRHYLQIGTIS